MSNKAKIKKLQERVDLLELANKHQKDINGIAADRLNQQRRIIDSLVARVDELGSNSKSGIVEAVATCEIKKGDLVHYTPKPEPVVVSSCKYNEMNPSQYLCIKWAVILKGKELPLFASNSIDECRAFVKGYKKGQS